MAGLVSGQMKELIVAGYVPDPHLGELSQAANSRIGGKEVIESLEVARKEMVSQPTVCILELCQTYARPKSFMVAEDILKVFYPFKPFYPELPAFSTVALR